MVLFWDSWPIAFSGCPRGPRVICETACPKHTAPSLSAETRSRTRSVLENPSGPPPEKISRMGGFGQRHSSCLWFQMLGVEARSSLPHNQCDGGNLSGQGQTRHLRPDALGQQCCVELLKWSGFVRCQDRRTLKQIFQIVIAVLVQSANRDLFLGSFQLSLDTPVIGAAACLDAKSAVRPQLPLGAESVRGLHNAQATRPPGSDQSKGSGRAVSTPRLFLALREQIPPHFAGATLSVHRVAGSKTRSPAHSGFLDLSQPLITVARCIDLFTRTGNGPTAIDRLHPRHDPP